MDLTEVGDALAILNASLNATSAVALVTGFLFIRRRTVQGHRRAMLTAVGASCLFLVFYVTRVALTGTHDSLERAWPRSRTSAFSSRT